MLKKLMQKLTKKKPELSEYSGTMCCPFCQLSCKTESETTYVQKNF